MNPSSVVAVIPLKAIARSKSRMAPTLSQADRALLMRRTFSRVAAAVRGASGVAGCVVVTGDDVGASWARDHGFTVVPESPATTGLNDAIRQADQMLEGEASIVLPADLPLVVPEDLDALLQPAPTGVVVAPTADGGTGALVRRPGDAIGPHFGPDSAERHLAAAERAGVPARAVWIPGLALDLDRPADLERVHGWTAAGRIVSSTDS
ncbi:2-phospho-L-lactate guanylyltransferase [Euzebya tangerina]|uniref:2-phospho-L-lactate guanylyltransferase n=1 Tax=Euzebya tangerina TaxID=591198 RepID=UPI000E31350E|nr:2-phospho-L-lactate guanylyltransferase [Euzebya tangerina]